MSTYIIEHVNPALLGMIVGLPIGFAIGWYLAELLKVVFPALRF